MHSVDNFLVRPARSLMLSHRLSCTPSISSIVPPFRRLSAFAWGNADNGQLGLPSALLQPELDTYGLTSHSPTAIPTLRTSSLISLSASSAHSAFLRRDGTLLTSGLSTSGQLGRTANSTQPAPVPAVPRIAAVACGSRHTLALSVDGVVYSFGSNSHGQLGREGEEIVPGVVQALYDGGHRVVGVAAGDDFSVAVCDQGAVYTWGCGATGRLGHGGAGHAGAVAFLLGNKMSDEAAPRKVRALEGVNVCAVFAGSHHVVVVDGEGQPWAWGSGRHFQLGTGVEEDCAEPSEAFRGIGGVQKVAPGGMHSLLLTRGGKVWAVGQNDHGCLGLGHQGATVGCATEPVPVGGIIDASDVAAGWHVSAAVARKGGFRTREVAMWGCGMAGALGNGDVVDHWAPDWIGLRARQIAIGTAGTSVIACD